MGLERGYSCKFLSAKNLAAESSWVTTYGDFWGRFAFFVSHCDIDVGRSACSDASEARSPTSSVRRGMEIICKRKSGVSGVCRYTRTKRLPSRAKQAAEKVVFAPRDFPQLVEPVASGYRISGLATFTANSERRHSLQIPKGRKKRWRLAIFLPGTRAARDAGRVR